MSRPVLALPVLQGMRTLASSDLKAVHSNPAQNTALSDQSSLASRHFGLQEE